MEEPPHRIVKLIQLVTCLATEGFQLKRVVTGFQEIKQDVGHARVHSQLSLPFTLEESHVYLNHTDDWVPVKVLIFVALDEISPVLFCQKYHLLTH